MAKSKRPEKKAQAAVAPAPTRFVRRRRSSRKRRSENKEPELSAPTPDLQATALANGVALPDAQPYDQLRLRAPRPAEPPPRNPNVFSYTYRVWKTS